MAHLELLGNESLNRQEQAAFSELADTLIFGFPQNFKLSRKNIPNLSRLVQGEFLQQEDSHEQSKLDYVESAISRMEKMVSELTQKVDDPLKLASDAQGEISRRQPTLYEKSLMRSDKSETDRFLAITKSFLLGKGLDESNPYNAWGFTPKLAGERTKQKGFSFGRDGSNCFGVVQTLGALYNKMGLEFEMGITADHPFAVVQVEGKTYLSSLFGVHEAKGIFEAHDGYKMYIPSPEDKIPYKLMTVWNFDQALVYELLENFEVLRQMSLGNKVETLRLGTEESGKKLAEQHHGTLQGASWRAVQEKVTPRLAAYFHDHDTQWAREVERVGIDRAIEGSFKQVIEAGQSVTSMKDISFDAFKEKFLPIAKTHRVAIVNFIVSGIECGPDIPSDVVLFAHTVKDALDAISVPELRAEVTQVFLRPFAEKETLTEE